MKTDNTTSRSCSRGSIVLGLLFSVTGINYLDRQTLSVVAPLLQQRLSLTTIGYSRVVFLFLLGYTIGQTVDGKIIDRIGTRLGMMYCVALWSVVSMFHSVVTGVVSLGILRFLLGGAEAGNWPGAVKAVAENFPPERRAFAIGVFNSGSAAGAILAPPLVVSVVGLWGWRLMFVVVGATGAIWVLLWLLFYRENSLATTAHGSTTFTIRPPTRSYLRERAVWGLMVGRFFADPVWWFYAFWLPEYLAESRGFSLVRIGHTAWIPFVFAGIGGWIGGLASDTFVRHDYCPVTARKVVMGTSALLMLCGIPAFRAQSGTTALVWVSIVLLGYTSWASNILSLPADLFHRDEVAQITGLSGTSGAIGGMVFTIATGWLVQNVSYGAVFIAGSGMIIFAIAVVIWLIPQSRTAVG